jgi:hypothetical protein
MKRIEASTDIGMETQLRLHREWTNSGLNPPK